MVRPIVDATAATVVYHAHPRISHIFEIADKYVADMAALNPLLATTIGAPGHEREMPDLSPAGPAAIADLNRRTLAQLDAAPLEQEADRIAREVMVERLRIAVEQYDAREYLRRLGIIGSPLQEVRQVFDLMAKDTETDWSNVAARLALVPNALAGYRQSLSEGLRRKLSASRRQASRAAEQARVWAGLAEADGQPSFFGLLERDFRQAQPEHGWPASLVRDMDHGARAARDAYAEMRRYLLDEYCPATSEREAAGEDRYVMLARGFLGAGIDPRETYDWGWQELYRIEAEMRATERRIQPGASAAAVRQLLETDPARAIEGVERYQRWLQELHDEALEQLHGRHFEIPDPIRR